MQESTKKENPIFGFYLPGRDGKSRLILSIYRNPKLKCVKDFRFSSKIISIYPIANSCGVGADP
tara:strand:+ start:190 stop:381 length:192 start_codon:yes stop_codon:yes gene_type:complete